MDDEVHEQSPLLSTHSTDYKGHLQAKPLCRSLKCQDLLAKESLISFIKLSLIKHNVCISLLNPFMANVAWSALTRDTRLSLVSSVGGGICSEVTRRETRPRRQLEN